MDLDQFDENISLLIDKIGLIDETCGLKHSKYDPATDHPATEYLCQDLGRVDIKESQQTIRIPICDECVEALYDPDWILAYCTYCHKSQWIYRPYSKLKHPPGNGIYWCDVCPFCSEVTDVYEEAVDGK